MGSGKRRLAGDTVRKTASDEITELRGQTADLWGSLSEMMMANRLRKKAFCGVERTISDVLYCTTGKYEFIQLVK